MKSGDSLGGYLLQRVLGEGGMGAVWLATDAEGQEVALKLMRDADGNFERFAREVEVLQTLDHPGIVRARSTLGHEGAHVFYAMDYVPGQSLEALLANERKLGPRAATEVCLGLLDALEAAHAEGVIHRDVKPGNVLVDTDGRPRLVDFGLSVAQDRTRLTAAGTILGTPAYMSPEQARGHEAGPASDLYAVGVLLFELLAGRPPFVASNAMALLRMHLDDEPPDLGSLEPLDENLVALVSSALAKDPAQRPPSAAAMAAALRALSAQAGQASTVVLQERLHALSTRELHAPRPAAPAPRARSTLPVTPAGDAPAPPRRRWLAVAALAALPLLVGVGLALRPAPPPVASPEPPAPEVSVDLLDGREVRGFLQAINPEAKTLVLSLADGSLQTLPTADLVRIRHMAPTPTGQTAPPPGESPPR